MKPAERLPPSPTRLPERGRGRKKLVLVGIAAVAIAGGVAAWRLTRPDPAPRFETAGVDRGRIVAQVTATGTLSALVTVQVGSQVSGRISQLFVDFNSPVKKGQLIAKLDPELFRAALEQSRANHVAARGDLTKAKVQAAEAQRQLARTRSLADRQLVAAAELDTAQANADAAAAAVDGALGRVAQASAALRQAEVNLAYTNVVSPINGTVISRSVDVGQTVAASLQAPTLFVIAEDLAKMQVNTSVAEADVGKLRDGMEATFTVDAYPGRRFKGVVRQIRNAAQTVQNVVTYDAVVDVENPDLALRPGMTANVTFVHADRQDVLRVPNAALRFRPPPELQGARDGGGGTPRGGAGAAPASGPGPTAPAVGRRGADAGEPDRRTVWVLRGERPEPVRIRTGVSDGSMTEVVEGDLREGDAAITDAAGEGGGKKPAGMGGPRGGPPRIL